MTYKEAAFISGLIISSFIICIGCIAYNDHKLNERIDRINTILCAGMTNVTCEWKR